jgi:hypothetical protein
LTKVIEIK